MIKRNRLDSQKLSEEVRKQKLSRLVSDFNKRDEPKKMYIDDKKMLLDTYKNYGSNIKKIIEKRANENMLRREKYKEEAPNNVQYAISEQGKQAFITEKQLVEKILSKLKTNNDHFIVEDSINLKLSIFNNLHVFNLTQLKSIEKDIRAIINYSERSTVEINSSVLIVDEMTNIKKILDKYIEKYSYLHTQDQKLEYINELLKLRHTEIIDELQEEIPDAPQPPMPFIPYYPQPPQPPMPFIPYSPYPPQPPMPFIPYYPRPHMAFTSPDYGTMGYYDRHRDDYSGVMDYVQQTTLPMRDETVLRTEKPEFQATPLSETRVTDISIKSLEEEREKIKPNPKTGKFTKRQKKMLRNLDKEIRDASQFVPLAESSQEIPFVDDILVDEPRRKQIITVIDEDDEDEYGKVEEEEQEYKGEEAPAVAIPAVAQNMEADIIAEIKHKYLKAPEILTNPPKNIKLSDLKQFDHVLLYDTDKPKVNGKYPVYNRTNVKKTIRLLREQIYPEFKK